MDGSHEHLTTHDRIRHKAQVGWVVVQIFSRLTGPVGDAHALQQAVIDDPTLTTFGQEVSRQDHKQYAEYREVQDEQRSGVRGLRPEPVREERAPRSTGARGTGSRGAGSRAGAPDEVTTRTRRDRRSDR